MVRPIDVSQVIGSLEYLGRSRERLAEIERREKEKKAGLGAQLGGIAGTIAGAYFGKSPAAAAAGGAAGSYLGAKMAGGNADSGQVAQSAYQGYQMGQQQQQNQQQQQAQQQKNQQNQQFNSSLATSLEQQENPTPQQLQLANWLKNSAQDYEASIKQAEALGYTKQARPNAAIASLGLDAADRLRKEYSDLETEGVLAPERKQQREQEFLSKLNRIQQLAGAPNITYEQAEKEFNRVAPKQEMPETVSYKTEDGKNYKVTSSGGQVTKKEEVSEEDMPSGSGSPTLKTAAEAATSVILNKIGGDASSAKGAVKNDLDLIQELSNVPPRYEANAQKQIADIRDKYDESGGGAKNVEDYWAVNDKGDSKFIGNMSRSAALGKLPEGYVLRTSDPKKEEREKTQKERLFDYMGTISEKARAGLPISENEFSLYKQAWLETMVTTDTQDAAGNKKLIREGGFLTPESLRGISQQPQSDSGAMLASETGQQPAGPISPITAAQAGEPIDTPYTETVQVGEKIWQKATLNDYEAIKFLADYDTATRTMQANVDNISWANWTPKTGDVAGKLISRLGAGGKGSMAYLTAFRNSKIAMQGFIKGNPSDADMMMAIEANAEPTNNSEYNKMVLAYSRGQIKRALKLKLEMMAAEKKQITPQMERIAEEAGINVSEIYKSARKPSREVYDSNMNEIRKNHALFASHAGDNYKPEQYATIGEGDEKKTYFVRQAPYLVSPDNKLFDGIKYTPRMAAEIINDRAVFEKLSREEKEKLVNAYRG